MPDSSTLADPNWAVTMFSFTTELVMGRSTPNELVAAVADAGLTGQFEIDAPQHFVSYPRINRAEIAAFRELVEERGLQLSMLGIYNDTGCVPGRPFTPEESVSYIGGQIRAAADLGFWATRIAFGVDLAVLEGLASIAEEVGVPVLQEVQGGATPDMPEFERQRTAIDRIGSDKLGFVFDLSACMAGLPVTYLEALRREGVPAAAVDYLDDAWIAEPREVVRAQLDRLLDGMVLTPSARVRLSMPFGRFGTSRVADWKDSLGEFSAIHLKFWDLVDADNRVSDPIADLRREFGALGYTGVVTSEWGGHEWFELEEANGFDMTRGHRAMFDSALPGH